MACILLIDDDAAVRSATSILLTANGFEVVEASDGKSGIDAIKGRQFDLAIVDLFMPGMNGLETTIAIRKISPDLPIITASGFMFGGQCPEMPNFDVMAAEAGAVSTLYKPFRPKQLLQAVQELIAASA
jgi:CheY-like chemotaxis protein